MPRLKNGLKLTVLTESATFFLSDTLKVTWSTVSTPKSYDEHPRQVKYGSAPRAIRAFCAGGKLGSVGRPDISLEGVYNYCLESFWTAPAVGSLP